MRLTELICVVGLVVTLSACSNSGGGASCTPNAVETLNFEQLYKRVDGDSPTPGFIRYEKSTDSSLKTRSADGSVIRLADNETVHEFSEADLLDGGGDLFANLPSFDLNETAGKVISNHKGASDPQESLLANHPATSLLLGDNSLAMDSATGETNPNTLSALKSLFQEGAGKHVTVCSVVASDSILQSASMPNYRSAKMMLTYSLFAHE